VARRAASQKEVNDLLSRKSTWSDADVVRFTALVREDHTLEQALAKAHAEVGKTEDAVERAFSALMQAILARYHEEQVWSDKIRSVSTYGSLTALGLNLVVFILAIIIVEPWKRKRMMEAFEKRVDEMMKETQNSTQAGLQALEERLKKQEAALAAILASSESGQRMVEAAMERQVEQQRVEADSIPLSSPEPGPFMPAEHQDWYRQWMHQLQNTDAITVGSIFVASVAGWLAHHYFGK
jgi:sensitive to high expression protein 9, mitochondrial